MSYHDFIKHSLGLEEEHLEIIENSNRLELHKPLLHQSRS